MIEIVTLEGSTWAGLPSKFEAGTPNIAGGIGLGAAIDYIKEIDLEAALAHDRKLGKMVLDYFAKNPKIKTLHQTETTGQASCLFITRKYIPTT